MRKRFAAGMLTIAMVMGMTACSNVEDHQDAAADTAAEGSAQDETDPAAAAPGTETLDAGTADTESSQTAAESDDAEGETADSIAILSYLDNGGAGETSGDRLTAVLTEGAADTAWKVSITDHELEEAQNQKLSYAAGVQTLVQFIETEDGAGEALQKALDQDNEAQMELMKENYAAALEFDQEMADMNTDSSETAESDGMYYSMQSKVILKRADEKILSYLREDYSFTGGAHPSTAYISYNYDPETGKALTLRDVVTDYDGLYEKVLEALQKVYEDNDEGALFSDYADTVKAMFYGTETDDAGASDTDAAEVPETAASLNWIMTEEGVDIIFNQYDIAPYAVGQLAAEIPFGTGLINENYR